MITGHKVFSRCVLWSCEKEVSEDTSESSREDLARVVDDSAACNVCQLVGAQDGRVLVSTRD